MIIMGAGHLPVVPRRRHLPGGAGAADPHRVDGPQRRRRGALRRCRRNAVRSPGGRRGDGRRLVASAASDDRHLLLVRAHRPVALRRLPGGRADLSARAAAGSPTSTPWMCWRPRWRWGGRRSSRSSTGTASASPTRRPRRGPRIPRRYVAQQLAAGALRLAVTDPDDPANWPRVLNRLAGQPARLVEQGQRVLPQHLLGHQIRTCRRR